MEHDYPRMGQLVPGAIETLWECVARGSKLILFTVRDGAELDAAVQLLVDHGIELHGINSNSDVPSTSPKPYYDLLIDDRALGCPLRQAIHPPHRPCVDWERVRELLGLEASWL